MIQHSPVLHAYCCTQNTSTMTMSTASEGTYQTMLVLSGLPGANSTVSWFDINNFVGIN